MPKNLLLNPGPVLRSTFKELGDAGEEHAIQLLASHGYSAKKLRVNAPTYDLEVSNGAVTFFVSVKASREKQHVRLGARRSVVNLTQGNFLFAFLPEVGAELSTFQSSRYSLLILPAEMVKEDGLSVHDPYWLTKGKDPNIFSVMVKGYGSHHRSIWPRWLSFKDAWHLLP